jgi:hypothetical protein
VFLVGAACDSPKEKRVGSAMAGTRRLLMAAIAASFIPVRDDDGRVVDVCSARLTATQVPGFPAVKMEVSQRECSEKTLKAGEFSGIFVGIILQLAEWVQKKGKPI